MANPNNRVLRVEAVLVLNDGTRLGPSLITLPPRGHTAFIVRERFPAADGRDAILVMSGASRPEDEFLAWTMNTDSSGTFSSLPPGGRHASHLALGQHLERLSEGAQRRPFDGLLPGTFAASRHPV